MFKYTFDYIGYILFEMKASFKIKTLYVLEKVVSFFLVLYKKITGRIPKWIYFIKKDYTISNRLGKFCVKHSSDHPFTINSRSEFHLLKYFKVKDDRIFIDIGAHVGKYSIYIGNHYYPKKIYSFEPNPETYSYLLKNLDLNKLENIIKPEQYAISKKKGFSYFKLEKSSSVSKLTDNKDINTTKVNLIDLDSFLESEKVNIKYVELIKIDVEGFEYDVFLGMKNLLKKSSNDLKIICEILPEIDKKMRNKIFELAKSFGFVFKKLDKFNYLFYKK